MNKLVDGFIASEIKRKHKEKEEWRNRLYYAKANKQKEVYSSIQAKIFSLESEISVLIDKL